MNKITPKTIVEALGRDAVTSGLGVSKFTIRHYVQSGVFPAAWYDGLDKMCRERGIHCPREIFNWKSSAAAPSAEAG